MTVQTIDDDDTQYVEKWLNSAELHHGRSNAFAEGFALGRALEHVEQNAMDYEWFTEELRGRGLDTGIVPVPKIEVNRG